MISKIKRNDKLPIFWGIVHYPNKRLKSKHSIWKKPRAIMIQRVNKEKYMVRVKIVKFINGRRSDGENTIRFN